MSGRPKNKVLDRILRRRAVPEVPLEELEPPKVLSDSVSGGDFRAVGREFTEHLVRLGGLRPTDRVLDIGCGAGRIAVPLLGYLDDGSYEGFDVHEEAIHWCQANISSRNGAFGFRAIPVQSEWFNPWGGETADRFAFPYPDDEFDFVFAISLFTHLLAPATERYLSEASRVLKPGGRWFFTAFLIPDGGPPQPDPGWATPAWWTQMNLQRNGDGCWVQDPDHPERAVGHDEDWLGKALAEVGLSTRGVDRGIWPGRNGLSYQDILIGNRDESR